MTTTLAPPALVAWSRFAEHRGKLIADLDVRLANGRLVTLVAHEDRGLVVIRGLRAIADRETQNAAAGAVRAAIREHLNHDQAQEAA
ncbi:MAG: hypothetical protein WKF94_03680 [Solirubrobacteraceae bacterium]